MAEQFELPIYLCDYCHRIVETRLTPAGALGNIRVPEPHRDPAGEFCDGIEAEVIEAWQ